MGDASQRAERPLDTELAAVDLVAAFHLTDNFPIHHYCAAADQLDNADPELVSVLREIGDCLNEKDREDEAWSQPLNLSHDLAKTWLAAAQTSDNIQSYLDATQRTPSAADAQSFDSKDGEGVFQYLKLSQSQASQATQSSLLMPPPNQQQQHRVLSPERRSSRSPQPRKMPGFIIEIDKGPAAASASITTKFSNTKTIFVSTDSESDGLAAPVRKPSTAQSSKTKAKRAKGKGKRKSKPRRTASSYTDEDGSFSSSELEEIDQVSEGGPPASLSAEERKLLASAKKVSDAADKTLRPGQKRKRFSIIDTSKDSGGEQDSRTYTSATGVKSRRTSKKLSVHKELLGPNVQDEELEVNISAPAYASKEGYTTSEGYKGFLYVKSWSKRDARGTSIKETWMCIDCGKPYTASQGHSSNLKTHKTYCRGPKDALAASKLRQKLENLGLDSSHVKLGEKTAAANVTEKPAGGSASSVMRSWLDNQQTVNTDLTRRLILVTVIRQALPFRWPSSESNKKVLRSVEWRSTRIIVSSKSIARDLVAFHKALRQDIYAELHGTDTLLSLQHDAWTTKGLQHSFVAITATFLDAAWNFHERLLSFDVIKQKHSGATFARHLLGTVKAFDLDERWSGIVTSDSAGTNHRMMDILEHALPAKGYQSHDAACVSNVDIQRLVDKSPSSFPKASSRRSGSWTASQNKILCLNHHVNLAVQAGFKTLGVKLTTKTQNKILDIHPQPSIQLTDASGKTVVAHERVTGAGEEAAEESEVQAEAEDEESVEDDAGSESDGSYDGDEEDVIESDMEPDLSELDSDDGGGPGAELVDDSSDERDRERNVHDVEGGQAQDVDGGRKQNHKLGNGVLKLQAFANWIHGGSLRRDEFRSRMEKEYHKDQVRATARLPPKPNKTRWNSHFRTIRASLFIRAAIDAFCGTKVGGKNHPTAAFLLTDAEWRQVEILDSILRIAAAVTKNMEQSGGTLYCLLDHHATLRDEIKIISDATIKDNTLAIEPRAHMKNFLDQMEAKLQKYRDLALSNRTTLAATMVHPENRSLFRVTYPEYHEKAEQALRDMVSELADLTVKSKESTTASSAEGAPQSSPLSIARARRQQAAQAAEETMLADEPDEVGRYLNPKNSPWRASDGTPTKWWRDNESVFPTVAKLARILLAVPGSSSNVERVFSSAGIYTTSRRSRLSAPAISRLVTSNHWLKNGSDELAGLPRDAVQAAESQKKLPWP